MRSIVARVIQVADEVGKPRHTEAEVAQIHADVLTPYQIMDALAHLLIDAQIHIGRRVSSMTAAGTDPKDIARVERQLAFIDRRARMGNEARDALADMVTRPTGADLPVAVVAEARRPRGFFDALARNPNMPARAQEYRLAAMRLTRTIQRYVRDDQTLTTQASELLIKLTPR